jgi:hypothetical protein
MNNLRIQIRSFVKGGNHGQYIGALGLYHVVSQILPKATVTILNYNNHFLKELYIQTRSFHLTKYISMRVFWQKRFKFSSFRWPDFTIYGSDMIWHLESSLFPPDKNFFGENDYRRKIAYAPSVACRGRKEPEWLKELLSSFDWIGARDRNTAEFVYDHCKKHSDYVIDPSFFLLDSNYIDGLREIKRESYLSIYSTIPSQIVESFTSGISKQHFSSIFPNIEYYGYFPRKRFLKEQHKQLQDPLKVIFHIAKSKMLLTSTFHGVMIALMTKTPFIALRSPNLDARLDNPTMEAFGSFRLVSKEQLKNLNCSKIKKFLKIDDLNSKAINDYLRKSKGLLTTALAKIVS